MTSCSTQQRYQANIRLQTMGGANVPMALEQIRSIINAKALAGVEITTDGFPENGIIHISAVGADPNSTLDAANDVANAFLRMSSISAKVIDRPKKAQKLINK